MCHTMRQPRCVYLQCRCSESNARCVLDCNRPSFSRWRSLCVYGYVHIQPFAAHCQQLYVYLHWFVCTPLVSVDVRYVCIIIHTWLLHARLSAVAPILGGCIVHNVIILCCVDHRYSACPQLLSIERPSCASCVCLWTKNRDSHAAHICRPITSQPPPPAQHSSQWIHSLNQLRFTWCVMGI